MTAPARRPAGGFGDELSQRDWAILHDVGQLRLLTGRHLQRLHLSEGSPLTQARRTRSTLQRLTDHGLLVRLERRIGGLRAGSAGFTYALSAAGQRLVTGHGPAGGRRLRRPWEPSTLFVDHTLAIGELYVRLREREAARQIEELVFEAEPACWRPWAGSAGEGQVLKPDAFVRYGAGDDEQWSFVEVDRASQSQTVIKHKADVYRAYYHSGQEQHRHGLFPRVLFVTIDDHRRSQIIETLSRLDPDDWRLFQVLTMAEAFLGQRPSNR